jgi:hypothetical protein
VGFEAAVSAATGEMRAGVAVERSEVARMQRSYRQFRAELARMGVSTLAALVAERDAARSASAESAAVLAVRTTERDTARASVVALTAERDAAQTALATRTAERDAARTTLAARTTERDAAIAERDVVRANMAARTAERDAAFRRLEERGAADDVRARLVALQDGMAVVSRRAELIEKVTTSPITDAIDCKVATPLTTPTSTAYLRLLGFPAGSQPAGITWGIGTVTADRLTASSVYGDAFALHPGCRLMYPDGTVAGKSCFCPKSPYHPGDWVCVDLGGAQLVAGALVQSHESPGPSSEGDACWHRHRFQSSADGAAWADVDGGRVWSRDGLARKDVSAAVFGAPVRCRYLRIVAVTKSNYLRWEVVVLP